MDLEAGIIVNINDRVDMSSVVWDKDKYERISLYAKEIFGRRRVRVEETVMG